MNTLLHSTDAEARKTADAALHRLFSDWQEAGSKLITQCAAQKNLREVSLRAQQLQRIGVAAEGARMAFSAGGKLSSADAADFATLLQESAKDDASMVDFVVLPPLKDLLAAVR